MSRNQIEEIYATLLARDYARVFFSHLEGQRQAGKETLATCPFCNKAGKFSFNSEKPVWKCWTCSEGGDWCKYLEKREGKGFGEALKELAEAAGIQLEGINQETYQRKLRKASILEDAQGFFQETLFSSDGNAVLAYLKNRGYTKQDVKAMELGAFPGPVKLKKFLKEVGHSEADIKEAGLDTHGFGTTHTLTLLWKDPAGRATGLVARRLDGLSEKKYLYSRGTEKGLGFVGFSATRGAKEVLLVEGVLDALYLNSKGFKAVAIGGTDFSREQQTALERNGTQQLIVVLDADQTGQEATEKLVRNLVASRISVYVSALPDGFKDPDALVREEGPEALRSFLQAADAWPVWLARRILGKHQLATDRGLDAALSETFETFLGIQDQGSRERLLETVRAEVHLSSEQMSLKLSRHRELATQKAIEKELQAVSWDLQNFSTQGNLHGAEQLLTQALARMKGARPAVLPEAYRLGNLLADTQNIRPGLATGFSGLDKFLRIPQGALTLVAGRPGHGKTTVLLNLLLNFLEDPTNSGKRFFFFSLEEANSRLAMKLLLMMSGHVFSSDFNQNGMLNYLQQRHGTLREEPAVEKALDRFKQLTESGRLYLSDQRFTAEDLAGSLKQLVSKEDTGAILVDYIQKIPTQQPAGQRYLDVKRASELLLEQAVQLDLPIIMGAQLGRQSDGSGSLKNLRESGDLEQDANLVLGLHNPVADKDAQTPSADGSIRLEVEVLKNRGGAVGRRAYLSFNPVTLKIGDDKGGPF